MRIGQTLTVCLLAYYVRKMMPDPEISQELMCLTYLDV